VRHRAPAAAAAADAATADAALFDASRDALDAAAAAAAAAQGGACARIYVRWARSCRVIRDVI